MGMDNWLSWRERTQVGMAELTRLPPWFHPQGVWGFAPLPEQWILLDIPSVPKSPSDAVSFLYRWWNLTPHRSFFPTTAPGSTPCLLLQRTRSLSRANSPAVLPTSLFFGALPFPAWGGPLTASSCRNLAFPDFIFRTTGLACVFHF